MIQPDGALLNAVRRLHISYLRFCPLALRGG